MDYPLCNTWKSSPYSSPSDSRWTLDRRITSPSHQPSHPPSQLPQSTPNFSLSSTSTLRGRFDPSASIVLVGICSTGKSTLAHIVANALGWRLTSTKQCFEGATQMSRAIFVKTYGELECQRKEMEVLEQMLKDYAHHSVIDCGSSYFQGGGRQLIRDFSQTHPVVYILRDAKDIKAHLKLKDTKRVDRLLLASGSIYRLCSNLEFYNLTDRVAPTHKASRHLPPSNSPFLSLKRLEHDLLRLLSSVATAAMSYLHPAITSPDDRITSDAEPYTYALCLSYSTITAGGVDFNNLPSADSIQLVIDQPGNIDLGDQNAASGNPSLDAISRAFALIRRHSNAPIIFHVQTTISDASKASYSLPNHYYFTLVHHGLRLRPDYITLDISRPRRHVDHVLSNRGPCKLIAHFYNEFYDDSGWMSDLRWSQYRKAVDVKCDMVRFIQPARSIEDNESVQAFRTRIRMSEDNRMPVIAYNVGPLGRSSVYLNKYFTEVAVDNKCDGLSSLTVERPLLTLRHCQEVLFRCHTLSAKKFWVFGASIAHSPAPAMFGAASKSMGMPHQFSLCQTSSLDKLLGIMQDPEFGGTSVSLPFKMRVIPLLHSISESAKAIGAVNTIIPLRTVLPIAGIMETVDGGPSAFCNTFHGHNTDWVGIMSCIRRGLSVANMIRPGTTGLIIGAGGMARAAVYAMMQLNVGTVFIYNRTLRHANELADHFNYLPANRKGSAHNVSPAPDLTISDDPQKTEPIETQLDCKTTVRVIGSLDDPWPPGFNDPTIIVSAIPSESVANSPPANFVMPLPWLKSPNGGVIIELAYNPLITPLLQQMRARSHLGWVTIDGLEVLPEQGFAQFTLYTGKPAPRRLMREAALRNYKGNVGWDEAEIHEKLSRIDEVTF